MATGLARLHSALKKFIHMWLESDELQELWGITPGEMDLYKADPGFTYSLQIARFGAFLHDNDLKFLEFNCDSPCGTCYADVIHRGFLEMFERNDMGGRYHVSNRSRIDHLCKTLANFYAEWRGNARDDRPEKPFTSVTDWKEVGSKPDIDITVLHLQKSGYDAVFADPRDLELRDDGVYFEDKRVNLAYKRVIVKELVEEPAAQALAIAYKRGQVCMVNPPRSVIPGNKKILAALRRPDVLARLTALERQAIADYVPWTEVLREAKVEFMGFTVNLRDFVQDNKDQLVLKAAQSYGGRDVFLGFETTQEDWEALMNKHIDGHAWIVQRLVPIPKELFPEIQGDEVKMNLMNININPLAFGGEYAGSYTRISKKNVLNVSFGGGMTATMTLERRGRVGFQCLQNPECPELGRVIRRRVRCHRVQSFP